MNDALPPGMYGKLPAVGDFVSRRLPKPFVDVWDGWLQSGLTASREQLGDEWLDIYLTSPIWRFGLSPGVCGDCAWAGVLMPSVDKVGRYFPLTLAAPLTEPESLPHLFGADGGAWFEALEQMALDCLEDGLSLEELDGRLQSHWPPSLSSAAALSGPAGADRPGKFACRVAMDDLVQMPQAFCGLSLGILARFLPLHSLWASAGSERIGASLLACEGLPPVDAFAALLTGDWERRGWAMQTLALPTQGATAETVNAPPPPAAEPVFYDDPDPTRRPRINTAPQPSAADPVFYHDPDPTTHPRITAPPPRWLWRSWGISVVGKRRTLNEDNMILRNDAGLWAVADGMGGHMAGDVASQAIVDGLAEIQPSPHLADFAEQVGQCLQQVNSQLCRLAEQEEAEGQIIGSTVVALLASGNRCLFQWAGDSRLYRFRDGALAQLSRDHSLLSEMSLQGLLSPEELADPGRCDIITRAVGADEALNLEQGECEAQPGDLFLLCSDGLDKELSREDIEAVFRRHGLEDVARILIEQAEERGARDNVTVVVVQASVAG